MDFLTMASAAGYASRARPDLWEPLGGAILWGHLMAARGINA